MITDYVHICQNPQGHITLVAMNTSGIVRKAELEICGSLDIHAVNPERTMLTKNMPSFVRVSWLSSHVYLFHNESKNFGYQHCSTCIFLLPHLVISLLFTIENME